MSQWLECIGEQLKLKPVTGQADTLWEIFWLWMTFTNVRAAKNQSYLLKDSHKVTCIRIRNSDFVIVIIIIIIIIMMIGSREFLEFLRNSSILIIIAIVFSIISLIISRGSWFGETRWSGWHVSGAQPDICASSACYGDGDDDCDLLGNWLKENTNPQGWAGMTFEGLGTGIENSIPKVWEREGNEKKHSQNSGTGGEWKKAFPKFGNGKGMKKNIPKIRVREGNEKIHSHISGNGIRGFHSWEWTGTGTGM